MDRFDTPIFEEDLKNNSKKEVFVNSVAVFLKCLVEDFKLGMEENKFEGTLFSFDGLEKFISGESDPKKIAEALSVVNHVFEKDLLPQDSTKRLLIKPVNYFLAINLLSTLNTHLIIMQKRLESGEVFVDKDDSELVFNEVSKIIRNIRKQEDHLDVVRTEILKSEG